MGVIDLRGAGVKRRVAKNCSESVTWGEQARLVPCVCEFYPFPMSPDADSFDIPACLALVRKNDQQAARELVEHLYPQVIRIVRGRLPRRMAEEDMAQEVFLKMFTRLDQYRGDVPFTHWISRIAVTTCIDELRKQQRRPELRWADLSEGEAEMVQVVTADEGAEQAGDVLEARELLEKLMDQLKPDDRMVIQLLDLEQKTLVEISELTGWNSTLVKVRAFRARKKLQKLLKELDSQERL